MLTDNIFLRVIEYWKIIERARYLNNISDNIIKYIKYYR